MNRIILSTMLFAILGSGCSTTTTVTMLNGRKYETHILGGDQNNVYVGVNNSNPSALSRKEIADIDHPGDGAIVGGSILSGYGALNIIAGVSHCEDKGALYCTGVFLPAAGGLAWLTWGLAVHYSEVNENNPLPLSVGSVKFLPVIGGKESPAEAGIVGVF